MGNYRNYSKATQSIQKPPTQFKKHFFYWILPSFITLACILIYYFDLFGWQEFIAPKTNREFGVVQNIQLLLLVIIFFLALKGNRRSKLSIVKYGFAAIAIATVILFFEEIDYGLHYYDYLLGHTQTTEVMIFDQGLRNIHNNGPLQNIFKLAAYATIVMLFVIFPLVTAGKKIRSPLFRFLSPSVFIVTTAISLLLLNQFALYLYRKYNSENLSLSGNVSEFEEIMIYYIVLLYINEMIKKPENRFSSTVFVGFSK